MQELMPLVAKWYPEVKRVAVAESQIPTEWPESVRSFCLNISLDKAIWSRQDHFLLPDKTENVGSFVRFMIENQNVVTWYFGREGKDPETFVDSMDADGGKISQGSFSYLIKILFYQNLKFREGKPQLWGCLPESDREKIKREYAQNYKGSVYWPGYCTNLYDCHDFVIELECAEEKEGYVYIASLNENIQNKLIKLFPDAEWD